MFKQTLRQHLEKHFPSHELTRWYDPLNMEVDAEGKVLHVSFPHSFFGLWFMRTMKRDFESRAADLAEDMAITYESGPSFTFKPQPYSAPAGAVQESPPRNSLPSYVPSQSNIFLEQEHPYTADDGLPEQYTFEGFLVNRKNDFPLAAAKSFVDHELGGQKDRLYYTPFVIYGQSGSGKSHLLGAMANTLKGTGQPLFYGGMSFLERIRIAPGRYAPVPERMVFLDDMQRVSAHPDFQEALVALVDMFRSSGRLLVVTLDAHPTACPGLGQKLCSRLCSGLVVELKRPDLDIRRQYVQYRNNEQHLGLTRNQMLSLAQRYHDLRSIDGALTRLHAYRSLVDPDEGGSRNQDIFAILNQGPDAEALTPVYVVAVIARHFSINPEDILGKSREKTISLARHIAILLCRELIGLSLVQTGSIFGGRDHSSVLYSIKKIKQLQSGNKDTNTLVEELRKLCLSQR